MLGSIHEYYHVVFWQEDVAPGQATGYLRGELNLSDVWDQGEQMFVEVLKLGARFFVLKLQQLYIN